MYYFTHLLDEAEGVKSNQFIECLVSQNFMLFNAKTHVFTVMS